MVDATAWPGVSAVAEGAEGGGCWAKRDGRKRADYRLRDLKQVDAESAAKNARHVAWRHEGIVLAPSTIALGILATWALKLAPP